MSTASPSQQTAEDAASLARNLIENLDRLIPNGIRGRSVAGTTPSSCELVRARHKLTLITIYERAAAGIEFSVHNAMKQIEEAAQFCQLKGV